MKYLLALPLLFIATESYAAGPSNHLQRHIKSIEIKEAWVRATLPSMQTSAAYMTIQNNTAEEDCLLEVTSEGVAKHTSLHVTVENEYDMISMEEVESICIPAHSNIQLVPGGYHIMLMRLSKELKLGHEIPLLLKFKNAGDIRARARVEPIGHK
jgi:copper(I)-binding protein